MAGSIRIQPLGFTAPITHAAEELARYLPQLAPVKAEALPPRGSLPQGPAPQIVVAEVAHARELPALGRLPAASEREDAYAIVPKRGTLYLVGANPRSVLFAAYRLLEELGAVFLRPGPGGEVLPRRKTLELPTRAIREAASYRHRGICIEGSPRIEHVLALLDWMAKKRMNSFQLQFLHAGVFWRRGYNESPEIDAASRGPRLSDEDCLALDDRVIARVKELGMMLHRVGHGWTAAAVDLPGYGWEQNQQQVPAAKQDWLAEVNGKRAVWQGVAANTELCYSKPEVRAAFVDKVVTYARQHSEVDLLHVWLSDSYNNSCECDACRQKVPTDWYVLLLNEIGRQLEADRLPTRVVFLGYYNSLWPPVTEQLAVDNVTFMFAPITRCYRHPLDDAKCTAGEDIARPALNACRLPRTNRGYADLMRGWAKTSLPDSFLFDYHSMWAVWADLLGRDIGAVMAQDMKDLQDLGLGGFISCQATRAFYPTPYLANAMADMLWDPKQSAQGHRLKIMRAAFGTHVSEIEGYRRVTADDRPGKGLVVEDNPGYIRHLVQTGCVGRSHAHEDLLTTGKREDLLALAEFAHTWQQRLTKLAAKEKDDVVRTSLEILDVHADHVARIARARIAGLDRDPKAIRAMRKDYDAHLPGLLARYSHWIDPLVAGPVQRALDEAEKAAR